MAEIERDNYYILLALEFDPPMNDIGKIKAALRAKKQEWTRWQDNPGKRSAALDYLGQAAEIERVMLDPILREKEAADAKELKRAMLVQFEAELRVLESKGYILPREAAAIAVKYKAYGVTPEVVSSCAKCPVSETAPPKKDDDDGEILDRVTARAIDRNLKILGHATLYAFLGEPPYSSVKKLLAAAEQARRSASSQGGKSSQAAISQELAGMCATLFESIQSKQKYDRYLKVSKYPAVGELLDEEAARSQYIGPEVMLRIVNFAVEKYGIKILEAEEYIKNYCAAYGVPVDSKGANITCPACQNKTPRSGAVCTICAQPLSGNCPSCGEPFEDGPAICSACGFSIGEMAKALEHLSEAESALIENTWSTAQRGLQYVKKYWPGHPRLELLEKRATLLEERYASYVESIHDCVKHRRIYAAQELISEAAARNLKVPAKLIRNVDELIASFENRVDALKERSGKVDIEQLMRLSNEVSDSIELGRLIAAYPPEPPAVLVRTVSGRNVQLTWHASESPYTNTYLLVRKQNAAPFTAYDGELLYEGPAISFIDTTASQLVPYHYSVFSKRAGAYSKMGAQAEPVLILPEIDGLRILPVDGGAQLKWNFNPDVRQVKIWRKLGGEAPTQPGDGILLENDRLDGFSDMKLKNDVEYWYYVVANYIVDGVPVAAKGVCESVVPRKTVAPLDKLNIAPIDSDGGYLVNWNSAQHADILMFCAAKRPDFSMGDIFPVEELLNAYRKLDLDYKRADSAIFKLGFSGGAYIFAAAVFGRFATVCEPRYIVNVPDIENPTCDVLGGNFYLNMKWPVGISEVAVAYRFDQFPKSPDEAGAVLLGCSREQYDFDAAVLIREPEPKIYYITIFSVYTSPDGQKDFSRGVDILVDNQPQQEVFYNFVYKKKRFTEAGTLDVTISSTEGFVLPQAVIVGKVGRLPLNRADGLPLFELDKEMDVGSTVSLQFGTSPLPSNIFIRLFLHDDKMYDKFRLVPTSAVKIT